MTPNQKILLIGTGTALALFGIGYAIHHYSAPKQESGDGSKGSRKGSDSSNTPSTGVNFKKDDGGSSAPSLPALKSGDMVYMSTSLSDSNPLELFNVPKSDSSQKAGESRPSWTGIQPIGKFKGYSSDKKFALVTFSNWQVWGGAGRTGTAKDVRKISGDFFVPVESISKTQY